MSKFCSRCGSQIKDGNQFCNLCGAPISVIAKSNKAGNNKIAALFIGNYEKQKKNVQLCGGKIFDKYAKIISLLGLFFVIILTFISPYELDGETTSAFDFWVRGVYPAIGARRWAVDAIDSSVVNIIVLICIVTAVLMLIMTVLNFTNYVTPYKDFWLKALIGYWCCILFNVIYFFLVNDATSEFEKYMDNDVFYFDDGDVFYFDDIELTTNSVYKFLLLVCVIICIYCTIKASIYANNKRLSDSRINEHVEIDGEDVIVSPSTFSSEIYIDIKTGELYILQAKGFERISDGMKFDELKKR